MTKPLKFYVITGCLFQFLVFHILGAVASQASRWFENNEIHQVPYMTTISLHMHPVLHVFTLAIWLFVAYAILKKKSDKIFVHILGILLVSSLGAVVFQGFGTALPFAGTLIGKID